MDDENIFDEFQKKLTELPGQVNILEENIDVKLQMEYIKCINEIKNKPDEQAFEKKDELFSDKLTIKEKKILLVNLAGLEEVECLRTIEKFIIQGDESLREWAKLSLHHSKMVVIGALTDQNQILISTGLGGKDSKLRYFIVLLSKDKNSFNDFQKKIINSEFTYSFSKSDAEIENINFTANFATIMSLIPINVSLKDLLFNAIKECNFYGDFINVNFIISNVKALDEDEIQKFLKENKI